MNQTFNLRNPIHFLAVGFGSGLLKPAPGTWGTLAAVPLYYLLAVMLPFEVYCAVVAVLSLAGIYICGKAVSDIGVHDHSSIVWDEFAGYWIAMALSPVHWVWMLVGFIYFRIFDILKPFPIGWLDKKVHGGLGIMLDDIIAGLFALGCMYVTMQAYKMYLGLPL